MTDQTTDRSVDAQPKQSFPAGWWVVYRPSGEPYAAFVRQVVAEHYLATASPQGSYVEQVE